MGVMPDMEPYDMEPLSQIVQRIAGAEVGAALRTEIELLRAEVQRLQAERDSFKHAADERGALIAELLKPEKAATRLLPVVIEERVR